MPKIGTLGFGGKAAGAPGFAAGEIGLVDAFTVDVSFTKGVLASDYAAGVTIKKNTLNQTVISATRQAATNQVHFVLSAAAAPGDALTFEYEAALGDYSNLSATKTMATASAQAVTNNLGGGTLGQSMGLLLGFTYAS